MKILKPLIIICLTIVCFGFSTPMYDRTENAPDLPKGDPDPEKGLVVRKHSSAFDVLRESSRDVKLGVRWAKELKYKGEAISSYIVQVRSPIPDKDSKVFRYIDGDKSFTIQQIYAPRINFNKKGMNDWSELVFYPFMAHDPKSKDEIELKLKEITEELDKTNWIDATDQYIESFRYPTRTVNDNVKNYKVYEDEETYILILVELSKFSRKKSSEDIPKYNIVVKFRKQIKI